MNQIVLIANERIISQKMNCSRSNGVSVIVKYDNAFDTSASR